MDDSGQSCEKILVDEPKLSSNRVEKMVHMPGTPLEKENMTWAPWGSTERSNFYKNVNNQNFKQILENEIFCLDESTKDALVNHTPSMGFVDLDLKVIFDELKLLSNQIEDVSIEFLDDDELLTTNKRNKHLKRTRWKDGMRARENRPRKI